MLYYWKMTRFAALVSFLFYPCTVVGRQNVPRSGGFILVFNHESNIDPILLPVACPRQMRFMAKEELFRNPVANFMMRAGGGFPVRHFGIDRAALKEFIRELRKGYPVLIFPQGTRGGTKVQSGAGFLAVSSGMPVLPVYIENTDKVLPKGSRWPKRTRVKVTFGKPFIVPSELSSPDAASQIMSAIYALKQ